MVRALSPVGVRLKQQHGMHMRIELVVGSGVLDLEFVRKPSAETEFEVEMGVVGRARVTHGRNHLPSGDGRDPLLPAVDDVSLVVIQMEIEGEEVAEYMPVEGEGRGKLMPDSEGVASVRK